MCIDNPARTVRGGANTLGKAANIPIISLSNARANLSVLIKNAEAALSGCMLSDNAAPYLCGFIGQETIPADLLRRMVFRFNLPFQQQVDLEHFLLAKFMVFANLKFAPALRNHI